MLEIVAVVVVLVATAFDALRDSWMRSEGWWKRHAVKWISFYLPLTYIMVLDTHWHLWLPLVLMSWVVWRLTLRYIGGVHWESMWTRWLRSWYGWLKTKLRSESE